MERRLVHNSLKEVYAPTNCLDRYRGIDMVGNRWTAEEIDFLKANIDKKTYRDIAEKLNKSEGAIYQFARKNNIKRKKAKGYNWSEKEVEYLEENWGQISIPSIANKLGRTVNAVRVKAFKIGLERHIHQGEFITFAQLIKGIGQFGNYNNLVKKLETNGFPFKYKKTITRKFTVVYIDDFWKFAEKNQGLFDFSKFEKNMLGPEPKWVDTKRTFDKKEKMSFKTTPWTSQEDRRLIEVLSKYKYNYYELSKLFKRSEGAIQRRICDLGTMYRPVKVDNKIKWTKEEYRKLGEMIKQRYSYNMMADILGKSSKAIRGRVYDMYLTENLDKVVALMNGGDWGQGRPQLNVTHKKLFGPERRQVKNDITQFVGILKGLMKVKYEI